MRIMIIGCGTIGSHLASALAGEGQDIIVIDRDEDKLTILRNNVDCICAEGSALDPELLDTHGIEQTDMVVAVTDDDATNLAIARMVAYFNVDRVLARIRSPEIFETGEVPPEHFGINEVISPEGITVDFLERLVDCPGAREAVDFERGKIAIRAVVVTEESPIAGEQLSKIRQEVDGDFIVAAIRRGSRTEIPDGNATLRVGDTVYIVCPPSLIRQISRTFNPASHKTRKVIIYGASITGVTLARRLRKAGIEVDLIEQNEHIAMDAARHLDPLGVRVCQGESGDIDLLQNCHAEVADFFIAVSDNDDANLMASLLFRRISNGLLIVQTQQIHYVDILENLDIDVVVNPRLLAISSMLQHIRSGSVISAFKISGEQVEILEFIVQENASIAKAPLQQLKLPKGSLVTAILRNDELLIPRGSTQLQAKDKVLVFTKTLQSTNLAKMFQPA